MTSPTPTDTNSSLSTFRRCPCLYELKYDQQLELVGDESEALSVGRTWHKGFEDETQSYELITKYAPNDLWGEKLRRLYAAYKWHWQSDDEALVVVEPEHTFAASYNGFDYEGQIDGVIETRDGRRGIIERKTTSEEIGTGAAYWSRLRLDVQVGLYALAAGDVEFILYDVVRKPSIRPKNITKVDQGRMRGELQVHGHVTYCGQTFNGEIGERALFEGKETPDLYGARLTTDIGERPDWYFQRRLVPRTKADYKSLLEDLYTQSRTISDARLRSRIDSTVVGRGSGFHRNPNSCHDFGRPCEFFELCSNNVRPGDEVPDGYRRREHRHPELAE